MIDTTFSAEESCHGMWTLLLKTTQLVVKLKDDIIHNLHRENVLLKQKYHGHGKKVLNLLDLQHHILTQPKNRLHMQTYLNIYMSGA